MDTLLGLLVALQAVAGQAHRSSPPPMIDTPFCVPAKPTHIESTLSGRYIVVGTSPGSGTPYSGTLFITSTEGVYRLTRSANGISISGKAKIEVCGEGVRMLHVTYGTKPIKTDFYCLIGLDYDNGPRATCGPTGASDWQKKGLEAWWYAP
jgi:hypothetical protein